MLSGTKGGFSEENRLGDFIPEASYGQRLHARLLHRTADDFSEELRRSFAHMWCENSIMARSAVKQLKCAGPDRKAISAIQGPLKTARKKPSPPKWCYGRNLTHQVAPGKAGWFEATWRVRPLPKYHFVR